MSNPNTDSDVVLLQRMLRRAFAYATFREIAFQVAWNALDADEEQQAIEDDRIERDNQERLESDIAMDKFQESKIRSLFSSSDLRNLMEPSQTEAMKTHHLNVNSFTVKDVQDMVADMELNGAILAPADVAKLIDRFAKLYRNSTQSGYVVNVKIPQGTSLSIVGDLHGQYADLSLILKQYGYPSPSCRAYLFNGDFVDRGPNGCEVLFTLYALKVLFPNLVFLNRGNHEFQSLNERFGFEREVIVKYGHAMFKIIEKSFDLLPIAHVIEDKVFVLHGGLSPIRGIKIKHYRDLRIPGVFNCINPEQVDEIIAECALWSDPHPKIKGYKKNPRGAGICFGSEVSKCFLQENDLELIVRSHELKSEGYEYCHDNRVLTIFSASNYCRKNKNFGAILKLKIFNAASHPNTLNLIHLDDTRLLEMTIHRFQTSEEEADAVYRAHLKIKEQAYPDLYKDVEEETMEWIRSRIYEKRHELLATFTNIDHKNSGLVTKRQWIEVLSSCFDLSATFPWYFLLPHLTTTDANGEINYSRFCTRYQLLWTQLFRQNWRGRMIKTVLEKVYESRDSLELMFEAMDIDHDGYITYQEFSLAMRDLELGLTDDELFEFARGFQDESQPAGRSGFSYEQFLKACEPHIKEVEAKDVEELRKFESEKEYNKWKVLETARRNFQLNYDELKSSILERGELNSIQLRRLIMNWCREENLDFQSYLHKTLLLSNGKSTINFDELLRILGIATEETNVKLDWQEEFIENTATVLFRLRVKLRRLFMFFDQDGNGTLTEQEFVDGLKALNILHAMPLTDVQMSMIHKTIDSDRNGHIDIHEFLACFSVIDTFQK